MDDLSEFESDCAMEVGDYELRSRVVEPLQVAAWRWVVGIQPAEDLPSIATDALVRDLDTPSLRELAGAPRDDYCLIRDLFEKTINEVGLDLPDEQTALWRLAQQAAGEITSGTVSPSVGAHWIWSEICDRIEREGDLRIFIGLADEWDDHPRHRPELEAHIVRAAEQLTNNSDGATSMDTSASSAGHVATSRTEKP